MENVSVETISETGVSMSNPELSGKQEKRLMKQENELTNTSQNGKADEAAPSREKKEGDTELVLSTREDSVADASSNGSSRKSPRRREKKKKGSSCEEKMLDNAEKNTNEERVHPPMKTLSYSIILEGSEKHTLDSRETLGAAQLCTGTYLSTVEDSQPDGTVMASSPKRKKKGKRDRSMLNESGVDIHSTNAEVTEKSDTIFEVEGSKSTSIEEKTVASVVISSCVKANDNTMEQQEGTSVKLNETVSQTQSPKAKKRKNRKTKTIEDCDPLGNTLATSMQSRPVECMENNDDNAGRELTSNLARTSNLASKRDNSATGEESGFQNLEKTKEKETDEHTEVNEDIVGAGLCDVRTKKRKQKKKNTSSIDHKAADMVGEDTTTKTEISATTKKSGVQDPGKRKERPEDETVESNQDALRAEGVTDVEARERRGRKTRMKIVNQ